MEVQIPDWLCNDFLSHCIQNEEGKRNAVVTNFSASPAAPPGNNYGSFIIRVRVEYKENEDDNELHYLYLIIKSELTEGVVRDLFEGLELSEPIFYNKFIPEASKFAEPSFAAKSLFSPKFSVTVLEDLKEQGYVMPDRTKQLDFDHCRLYVEAAATLHAVSFVVHKENPELVESIGKEKLFSNELKMADMWKNMIKNGLKCMANRTERIDQFKKYCKTIMDTSDTLWDMLVEAHKPSEVLNTINQGDPWATNMMFKYDDDGKVSQVKLLDFQALRYGSPVNDLIFFVWSSADHEIRRNRLQELYQIYLDALNNKLKDFNCSETLPKQSFMDNVKKLNPLAMLVAGVYLPSMLNPTPVDLGEVLSNKNGDETNNLFEKYYDEYHCKTHLPKLLEQLELAGVFEYLEKYQK